MLGGYLAQGGSLFSGGGAIAAGGSAFKAYGAHLASKAEAAGYKHTEQGLRFNAAELRRQGAYRSWVTAKDIDRTISGQKAAFSGNVELEGTAVDVLMASMEAMTLDKLMDERNTRLQASQMDQEAHYYGRAAKKAKKRGVFNAIASFF